MADLPPPTPDWLTSYQAKRKPGWQKGQSGNPRGRKPGSKNKRSLIAAEFEKAGSEVARVCIAKALEGDAACLSLVLTRIEPPLRPRSRTVEFDFDPDGSVAEQSKQILTAVSKGQVDPDTAKMLLDMLSAYVGLKDIEAFLNELKKLRNELPTGGVWTYDVQKA